MNSRFSHITIRHIACFMLLVIVCSCTSPPPPPPEKYPHEVVKKQHPKPAKPYYEMDAYVKQLAIAKILLTRNPYNVADVITQLETIQVFAAEKQKESISQPVIIITYHIKGFEEARLLVVPFKLSQNADFPELNETLSLLEGTEYIMDDIQPATIRNLPARNLEFPVNDPQKVKNMVERELSALLLTKAPFTDIDEAQAQLNLLQFFITHHIRDAAYLAAENAEQSLANAEKSKGKRDIVENLSGLLDAMEIKLHKEMPFTISTF